MTLPAEAAQLSHASLAALRALIGYSLSGRATEPHLTLRARGHFTSQGVYEVTWRGFVLEPKKSRFSKRPNDAPPAVWCHVEQTEIGGGMVRRLVVETIDPAQPAQMRSAGHAVGAVAMFPLSQIEVLSSPEHFPLADAYDLAPPILADVGLRFAGTSPAGNRFGFALLAKPGSTTLYFQDEDGNPTASLHENEQRRDTLDVRLTLS